MPFARLTVKPVLEIVEERILLSAANLNPLATVAVASPPAAPSVAAVVSYVESTMEQVMTAEQQEARALVQIIAQEQAYLVQEVKDFLGISTPPNPTLNTAAQQTGSGTTLVRSGSGSGTGATPSHPIVPKPGNPKTPPGTKGSGIGFDAGLNSSSATVSGQVWLDNNGDNSLDDGEMGYVGATVNLINVTTKGVQSTTTDENGDYNFTFYPYATYNYQIQVVFPGGFWAALKTSQSQIDANGYSQDFTLGPGGSQTIWGGIQSTQVTTTDDDPYNDPDQNLITLRDAISTANNGEGQHQGNTLADVTFVNPLNGGPLTGTITLQKALDPIAKNYNIVGPGAGSLTIQGQGNANNPFGIFKVTATSTISGLTITGGYLKSDNGGGIDNLGNLTLKSDVVKNNQAQDGGGIANHSGAKLIIQASQITGNNASSDGGGISNTGGTASMSGITSGSINGNSALFYGGGLYVASGTVNILGGVGIKNNTASLAGGGAYIAGGNVAIAGGTIASNTANNNNLNGNGGGIFANGGTLTLTGENIGPKNTAEVNGGGMYLANGSTTTFKNVTVSGNILGNGGGKGKGVAYEKTAILKPQPPVAPGALTDNDDPNGPVPI